MELCFTLSDFCSLFFYTVKNIGKICIQFVDLVSVAWVEWKCDHWLYCTQIYINHTVVVSNICRIQFFVFISSAMNSQEFFCIFICSPDRRKTGCLCCHYIDTVTEVCFQSGNSRSYKFHNFILNISVFEDCSDDRKCDILRSDPRIRFSIQVDCDDFRTCNIICITEKLFYKLTAAFTDCHGTKCTVTCMGVRSEDHFAASCKILSHVLMDNCNVWWYIDSAVFLCCGKSKHMIILVDCSTYCTK